MVGNSVSSPGQSLIGWVELPTEVGQATEGRTVPGASAGLVQGLSFKVASPPLRVRNDTPRLFICTQTLSELWRGQ